VRSPVRRAPPKTPIPLRKNLTTDSTRPTAIPLATPIITLPLSREEATTATRRTSRPQRTRMGIKTVATISHPPTVTITLKAPLSRLAISPNRSVTVAPTLTRRLRSCRRSSLTTRNTTAIIPLLTRLHFSTTGKVRVMPTDATRLRLTLGTDTIRATLAIARTTAIETRQDLRVDLPLQRPKTIQGPTPPGEVPALPLPGPSVSLVVERTNCSASAFRLLQRLSSDLFALLSFFRLRFLVSNHLSCFSYRSLHQKRN